MLRYNGDKNEGKLAGFIISYQQVGKIAKSSSDEYFLCVAG